MTEDEALSLSEPGTYQLVEGRHGQFLCNPRDNCVGRSLIAYGEWGEAEVRLFERFLRSGDVVIEVGSNLGSHTVPLSKAVGSAGAVHAIEPQRLIHQLLCGNLALNGCFNVYPRRVAAGDHEGIIDIADLAPHLEMNYGAVSVNWRFEPDTVMERLPLITLDSLGLPKVDFVKIDAEGLDVEVLRGASRILHRDRPALFVEAAPPTFTELFALLNNNDYEAYWYCSQLFDSENVKSNTENIWFKPGYIFLSADIFAVPRDVGWDIQGLTPVSANIDWQILPQSPDNFRGSVTVLRP
jgi:FkbM family methyltransferase